MNCDVLGFPRNRPIKPLGAKVLVLWAASIRDGSTQDWRVERRGGARDFLTSLRINSLFVGARVNLRRRRIIHYSK